MGPVLLRWLCLSTGADPAKTKKGYYSPFAFLDSHTNFDANFGESSRVLRMISSGIDINYVGYDEVDPALHVQDVSKQLSLIKQTYTSQGRIVELTPDKLFNKFCALLVSLPENAKTWPVQLCSLFLRALNSELADHVMTESGFAMSNLTTLTTKALQLNSLC